MSIEDRVFAAVTRALNRCTLALLRPERAHWGAALIAEQQQIADPMERLAWAAGGIRMTFHDFRRQVVDEPLVIALALAVGLCAAAVDVRSATRAPHVLILFSAGAALALWRPRWAWRWALLLSAALPVLVLITRNWGPYAVDQFDVFYGVVPASIGAAIGVITRRLASRSGAQQR